METTHQLFSLNYTVVKKNKKNISIKINQEGKVIIYAPYDVSYKYIEEVVKNKMDWILKKICIVKKRINNLELMGISQGRKILWIGKLLNIKKCMLDTKRCYIKIIGNDFVIYGNKTSFEDQESIKCIIYKFYREKAKLIFRHKVNIYSKKLNVYPESITIRCQKTMWGSCCSNGNINLNLKLLMAPMKVIEYIIIHELCHLTYMNHSMDYWRLVEHVMPDYKKYKEWIKNRGYMLIFPLSLQYGIYT